MASPFVPPVGAFPLLQGSGRIYLDNAATTQKPQSVLAAMDDYYRRHNANVHRAAHWFSQHATDAFEAARRTLAQFVNARRTEEIVWTRGTTEAINLVANSFGASLQPGDEILLTLMEHHANIVPWQLLAERTGVTLRYCPLTPEGEIDRAAFADLLGPRTRLVAFTQVSNALGTCNPLAELCRQTHDAGALVLVDGAQAVAHVPVDVQALGCDFYVFSGHKMYGPTGIGVLWGRYELLEQMPPWQAGGEMISRVSTTGSRFQPPPLRFEAGTPAIAEAIGLAAATDFLRGLDRTALAAHEEKLLARLQAGIEAIPQLRLVGTPARRCAVLSFRSDRYHSLDLAALLDQHGIAVRAGHHCCMPLMEALGIDGTVRASVACYTTEADADRLLNALDQLHGRGHQTSTTESDLVSQLRSARNRDRRHALLMKAGANPLSDAPELHQDDHLVHGCSSRVWLRCRWVDDRLQLELDSDARIVRGLLLVIRAALAGRLRQEVRAFDADSYFAALGLTQQLTSSRTSGIRAVVEAIQASA